MLITDLHIPQYTELRKCLLKNLPDNDPNNENVGDDSKQSKYRNPQRDSVVLPCWNVFKIKLMPVLMRERYLRPEATLIPQEFR